MFDVTIASLSCWLGTTAAIAVHPALAVLALTYLAWFAFSARVGQTPGKQAFNLYLMREDGSRAGGWHTVVRELLCKSILFWGLLGFILPVVLIFFLFDARSQTWWDKLAGTHVAYSPAGFVPRTAQQLGG